MSQLLTPAVYNKPKISSGFVKHKSSARQVFKSSKQIEYTVLFLISPWWIHMFCKLIRKSTCKSTLEPKFNLALTWGRFWRGNNNSATRLAVDLPLRGEGVAVELPLRGGESSRWPFLDFTNQEEENFIFTIDNLHNRLTFDLGKKNWIFYYS